MTTVDALDNFLRRNPDLKPHFVEADSFSWGATLSNRVWNQPIDRAFSQRSVQRDSESPIDLHIDDHYWVLEGVQSLTTLSGVTGVLVRDEYSTVVADIIRFVSSGSEEFLDNTNSPGNADPHAMDQDAPAQPNSFPFKNPFDQTLPSVDGRDVILTGSPGVGKTFFLYVLLAFRLAAGLTTLFHDKPGTVLLFSGAGVFEITTQAFPDAQIEMLRYIFPSAWCLVDSNSRVIDIPEFILRTRLPIIQAASPRQNRFDWRKKRSNVDSLIYYMKPWSLSELIVGRILQKKKFSEKALQYWHERYVPLARVAYNRANNPKGYEQELKLKLRCVTAASISGLLSRAILAEPHDEVSHEIVVFVPDSRTSPTCIIPTIHIFDLVTEGIANSTRIGIEETYRQFLSAPYMRGAAGHLLERTVFRNLTVCGGHPITPMSVTKKYNKWIQWKPQSDAVSEWLSLGHDDVHSITVETNEPQNSIRPAGFHVYDSKLNHLDDGYLYIPKSANQPTFDAFFYHQKVAIGYQITVGGDHDVKPQGLKFLKDLGVEKVYFVGVSSDHKGVFKISQQVFRDYEDILEHPCHYLFTVLY